MIGRDIGNRKSNLYLNNRKSCNRKSEIKKILQFLHITSKYSCVCPEGEGWGGVKKRSKTPRKNNLTFTKITHQTKPNDHQRKARHLLRLHSHPSPARCNFDIRYSDFDIRNFLNIEVPLQPFNLVEKTCGAAGIIDHCLPFLRIFVICYEKRYSNNCGIARSAG